MFRSKLVYYSKICGRGVLISSAVLTQNLQNEERTTSSTNKEKNNAGWERLKAMYSFDEYGEMSKEMNAVIQTSFLSGFFGICYGGFIYSREAYLDFMERNQAKSFTSHLDAKRQLQNHVTIHFARGGFRWGWRLSFFCGLFMLTITSLTAYRGHTSVFDYMGGGLVAGAAYQFKLGPRGMIVGGTLGGVLGLIAGFMAQGLLSLTDSSFDELITWQQQVDKIRSNQMNMMFKKKAEETVGKEKSELLQHHAEIQNKNGGSKP